ncbi:hypothetical protein 16Q_138 [Pseudomonas phage 16Q]|nr:hypothetical protein 16Q_138 [Pseudomonas phage 16Q]
MSLRIILITRITPTLPVLYSSVWPLGFRSCWLSFYRVFQAIQPLDKNIYWWYSHVRPVPYV